MLANDIERDLIEDEGMVLHAYQDHLGYWTLGVGRLVDKAKGGGISEDEALYLLRNDITRVTAALAAEIPGFDGYPLAVRRALVNMAFQLGVSGLLAFRRMLAAIGAGDYAAAADEGLQSKWAQQTPTRAKKVTDMIRGAAAIT